MVSVRGRIRVVVAIKLSGEPQETPTILIADPVLAMRQNVPFSAVSTVAGAAYQATPADTDLQAAGRCATERDIHAGCGDDAMAPALSMIVGGRHAGRRGQQSAPSGSTLQQHYCRFGIVTARAGSQGPGDSRPQ